MTIVNTAQECLDKIAHGRSLVTKIKEIDKETQDLALIIVGGLGDLDLAATLDESFSLGEGKSTTLKLKRKSTGEVLAEIDGYHWVEALCLAIKQEVGE